MSCQWPCCDCECSGVQYYQAYSNTGAQIVTIGTGCTHGSDFDELYLGAWQNSVGLRYTNDCQWWNCLRAPAPCLSGQTIVSVLALNTVSNKYVLTFYRFSGGLNTETLAQYELDAASWVCTGTPNIMPIVTDTSPLPYTWTSEMAVIDRNACHINNPYGYYVPEEVVVECCPDTPLPSLLHAEIEFDDPGCATQTAALVYGIIGSVWTGTFSVDGVDGIVLNLNCLEGADTNGFSLRVYPPAEGPQTFVNTSATDPSSCSPVLLSFVSLGFNTFCCPGAFMCGIRVTITE